VGGGVTILTQTPGNNGGFGGGSVSPPSNTDTAYTYLYGYGGSGSSLTAVQGGDGFQAMMAIAFY
jgi:hypothetical protein